MKFYIASLQKLKNTIIETSMFNNEKFISTSSMRIFDSSSFHFLSGEEHTQKDYLKQEEISIQLNSLSKIKDYWDINPNLNLYDIYREKIFLMKKTDKEALIDMETPKILFNEDGTETELLQKYKEKLAEYEELSNQLDDLINEYDENFTAEEKMRFDQEINILKIKIELLIAKWKLNGLKDKIENALKKMNSMNDYDKFLNLLEIIKTKLINAEQTGVQSLNLFAKLQMYPQDFYVNELAWNTLEIESSELNALFTQALQENPGINTDMISLEYDENYLKKISFQYCVVNIKRSWLNTEILDSEYLVSEKTPEEFVYAKKIILIKKLRIFFKDNLNKNEKEKIQNNIFKFGNFFMKTQVFTNKISGELFVKPVVKPDFYKQKLVSKINNKLIQISPINTKNPPKLANNFHPHSNKRTQKIKFVNNVLIKAKPLVVNNYNPNIKAIIFEMNNIDKLSNVFFNISDSFNNSPVYKAEIMIKHNNKSFYKAIETDQNGKTKVSLQEGDYNILISKNGYKEISFNINVKKDKNIDLIKKLKPTTDTIINNDSYILMGIIGERIKL